MKHRHDIRQWDRQRPYNGLLDTLSHSMLQKPQGMPRERKLTSKEGNGASEEACEADVQGSVHQACGQAIGDPVLHQGALNHV